MKRVCLFAVCFSIFCSSFALSAAWGESNQVLLLQVTASSDGTQSEKWPHHPEMVSDGSKNTCWASSSSDIIGSWLKFEFKERVILSGLEIINGWIPQDYSDFFLYNHRAKQMTIIFDDGSQEIFTLEDNNGSQKILFKERKLTKFIKVQIDKIYPSTKGDKPWVTISEISFYR